MIGFPFSCAHDGESPGDKNKEMTMMRNMVI
jgi:hypothetical protein